MSKEAYDRPWKDRDGIEGPVGAQWERRWGEEFEDWFCMHDHSTMAMQARLSTSMSCLRSSQQCGLMTAESASIRRVAGSHTAVLC